MRAPMNLLPLGVNRVMYTGCQAHEFSKMLLGSISDPCHGEGMGTDATRLISDTNGANAVTRTQDQSSVHHW